MRVNKKQVEKWVRALRSGKYKQTDSALQDSKGFCCLGVACDILIPTKYKRIDSQGFLVGTFPPAQDGAPRWLKNVDRDFNSRFQGSFFESSALTFLNDSGNYTFDEIADLIQLVYLEGALDESV